MPLSELNNLLISVRQCQQCQAQLPLPAKPILQAHANSKILIAGQAPGKKTHEKGIPFDDASGNRLREWLGVSREQFYQAELFAIIPMGFCYPGTGKSGDLPPIPECAQRWRTPLLNQLKQLKLTCIIGQYALHWHLKNNPQITQTTGNKATVTEHVKRWQEYLDQGFIVLPHPSPRNNRWLKHNPWFEAKTLPALRYYLQELALV